MKLKFGWTANDWFWRFAALSCIVLLPVIVPLTWTCWLESIKAHGFWESMRLFLKDTGLTLVYGNYDNTKL